MKIGQIKRQGDVALEMITSIPATANKINSTVIARGENGNHAHAIAGEVEVFEGENGALYVNAKGEFELKHVLETEWLKGNEVWTKEHEPLTFPAGKYAFLPQFEYHPYTDEIERMRE